VGPVLLLPDAGLFSAFHAEIIPTNPRIGKLFSAIFAAKKDHIPLAHPPIGVGLSRTAKSDRIHFE
jgi:hypothetical protein